MVFMSNKYEFSRSIRIEWYFLGCQLPPAPMNVCANDSFSFGTKIGIIVGFVPTFRVCLCFNTPSNDQVVE